MRYIWQHLKAIIDNYDGSLPLSHYLKSYCRQYPRLGSRDRRMLSDMAYSWYRASKGITAQADTDFEGKMKMCLKLCDNESVITKLFDDPATTAGFSPHLSFPFPVELSAGLSKDEWLNSLLVQPDLFIRIRKNRDVITGLLETHSIPYKFTSTHCLSLPNGAKIDAILPAADYVVQDASSQLTGDYFHPLKNQAWYDCCAGAGGKSLILRDKEPTISLTVTDIRERILHNLKERFRAYGLQPPAAFVTDVADGGKLSATLGTRTFDNIICDAPCSGSGTWARTPEQLYFFNPASLERYTSLQKSIGCNVSNYLKPGGTLFYITCSVFRAENEDVVSALTAARGFILAESALINGIPGKADCMFIAVLQSPAI